MDRVYTASHDFASQCYHGCSKHADRRGRLDGVGPDADESQSADKMAAATRRREVPALRASEVVRRVRRWLCERRWHRRLR